MTPLTTARDDSRSKRTSLLAGFAVAVLCTGAGAASAQTTPPEETTDPAATQPAPELEGVAPEEQPSESAPEAPAGDAKEPEGDEAAPEEEKASQRGQRLTLTRANASPRQVYWVGRERMHFRYEFKGASPSDLRIELVREGKGTVIKRWRAANAKAGKLHDITWAGRRSDGVHVKKGTFFFRVRQKSGKVLSAKNATGKKMFKVKPAIFPVRGPHQYWDGWGAGRGHRGTDIGASCGTRMVAAEPGKVAYKGYNGGGYGYYLVINIRGGKRAHVYGHLKGPAKVASGAQVKTGQTIGQVGETGNASGCHLHFEYWKGTWPGGTATSASTKRLRTWDKWS